MQPQNRIGQKMRQIRELQSLSVEDLAERSSSSVELIQALEAGELVPSLTPLLKIARALGVRLGTFLDDEEQEAPVIVRSGKSENVVRFSDNGLKAQSSILDFFSLAAGKSDRHMEPFIIDVHLPRSEKHDLSSHEGEEFLYVLSGQIEVCYGQDCHTLSAGDSAYYDSIVPHHVHAVGEGDAKILAVVYQPF